MTNPSVPSAAGPTTSSTSPSIPWSTVLGFAVVLAAADWFWVISLRGAVGAIERTREPFISWVQGSVMLTPMFAFAVLGALALAYRWFGPVLHRPRSVIAAGLLVVAAVTVAGLGALVVSGGYDLRLQLQQLDHMMPMGVDCVDSCVTTRRDATLALQLKAVGFGSAILLVTNLIVVGWLIAVRGGHLSVTRRHAAGRPASVSPSEEWSAEVQLVLIAALLGTGTVLATHATADLLHSAGAALLLLVLAAAQLAAAQLVSARPGRPAWVVAAVLALGLPALWLYAHTAGNALAPLVGEPGGFGLTDGSIGVLEIATVGSVVLLLSAPAWMRRAPASPHAGKLALVGIVAVTAIGIGGTGLAMFDLGGVDENPAPGDHHVAHR